MLRSPRPLLAALPALLSGLPAAAQEAPKIEPEQGVFDGNFLIIGAGPVAIPSYEGSDDLAVIPAAADESVTARN